VTRTEELAEAANQGKSVSLLAGLNVSTSPEALSALLGVPNCEVRYLTTKFHAKIFIFDEEALLGSSNLTMGGLQNNREATVVIDDIDEVDELKAIFSELWESAQTLTPEKLKLFTSKREMYKNATDNFNQLIEAAVGKAEPPTLRIESRKKTAKSKYLEALSRDIEQYRAAFNEVKSLLEENQLRRTDLEDVGMAMETNRFLNWLRLTHIHGDEPWQSASFKSKEDRKREILQFGKEWVETP
jgi:phosphatidylserine/phosphatidylglycerophosphate/cardiolipin synthase-like enzyme